MISYIEFLEVVKDSLHLFLEDEYEDAEVSVIRAEKHLSNSYDGICITTNDSDVGICFDVSEIYELLEDDFDAMMGVAMVAEQFQNAVIHRPAGLTRITEDKEFFLDHIMMQLVDFKSTEALLGEVPIRMFRDMAIIYRLVMPHDDGGFLTTVVTNSFLKQYNITEVELFKLAMSRCPMNFPLRIKKLDDLVYLASCGDGLKGSGCIVYPNFIKDAGDIIGSNFFVLPFSIDTVMLIKDAGDISNEFLEDVACRLNLFGTEPNSRLSKCVYYCDVDNNKLIKARDYDI